MPGHSESEHEFEYCKTEPVTPALLHAYGAVHDSSPQEFPSLGETIPCDALETLLAEGNDVTVTFSFEGCYITVRDDGQLVIRTPK